jgi:protein phosphatase
MRVRIVQSGATPAAEPSSPNQYEASTALLEVAARTDVGRHRANNEDNFSVAEELGLFVLSDGMGGEAAGELASKIAVEEVTRHMGEFARNSQLPAIGEASPQLSAVTNQLGGAVRRSNRIIWEAAQHHASQRGMGATVVVAAIQMPVMSIAHVGDSRIYLLRGGSLQQLTQDHSLVMEQVRRGLITREQAEKSEMQNIIIRALGADETVQVDLDEVFVMPGDHVILCSDGLTKMVPDEGIAQVVGEAATPRQAAERLVEIANENGGEDNISVIVVTIKQAHKRSFWNWLKSLFS